MGARPNPSATSAGTVISLLSLVSTASQTAAFVVIPTILPTSQQPHVFRSNNVAAVQHRTTTARRARTVMAPSAVSSGGAGDLSLWKRRGPSSSVFPGPRSLRTAVGASASSAESENAVAQETEEGDEEVLDIPDSGVELVEAEEEEGGDEKQEVKSEGDGEEAKAEGEGEEAKEGEGEKEEEEPDPLAETKQLIKDLEVELLAEEEKLAAAADAAQEKGKTGFLRIAATMENLRRKSGEGSGAFEQEAKADVLAAVLPVMKAFEEAEEVLNLETESETKYSNNYQAIYRQLEVVFTKIGASKFFAVVGEKFDYRKHEKVSEVYCEAMAASNVMECLSPGMELGRNVISKAKCVVSLGPEPKPEEEQEKSEEEGAAEEGAETEGGEDTAAGEEGEEPALKEAGVDETNEDVEGGEETEAPGA